jgi:hypothetical protein
MKQTDTGIVPIHGKEYRTVALRINLFRADHPDWSISCKIISDGDVVQIKATIRDNLGRALATGFAEEIRGSTNILKTSALETCETSAIGRALAFLGYGGTEIASADEVANAMAQQKESEQIDRLIAHNRAVNDFMPSILEIKRALLEDNFGVAYECFSEIPDDALNDLRIAYTKGGIFTTAETAKMKSDAWSAARKAHHGITNEGEAA